MWCVCSGLRWGEQSLILSFSDFFFFVIRGAQRTWALYSFFGSSPAVCSARGAVGLGIMERHGMASTFLKDATVVVDISGAVGVLPMDIISAFQKKCGVGSVLACRPRGNGEFEMTLGGKDLCVGLEEGVEVKGVMCPIRGLCNDETVVSFIHLPAYIMDVEIISKLSNWGVTPVSAIRRRHYPGTMIADGTRFVKVKFTSIVKSLPYSTRFDTVEGAKYFRVIHDRQVKICRLCMQPGHIFKNCPDFKCRECQEQGHYARDCTAVRCPECSRVMMQCMCEGSGDEMQSKGGAGVEGAKETEGIVEERVGASSGDTQVEKEGSAQTAEEGEESEDQTVASKNGSKVEQTNEVDEELEEEQQVQEKGMGPGEGAEDEDGGGKEQREKDCLPLRRRRRMNPTPNVKGTSRVVTREKVKLMIEIQGMEGMDAGSGGKLKGQSEMELPG